MKALTVLAAFAALFTAAPAGAQSYPARAVTIVVPYATGGQSDALARGIAQRLSTQFQQPVIVDNKPGANTLIGAAAVAKAPADGYTLLLTAEATLVMNPHLYAKLPYDPAALVPVSSLVTVPQGLAVSPAMGVDTMAKFLSAAREKAGQVTYATLGTGSTAHLNMELFQKVANVKLNGVPYKGAGPAMTDLMGGHVQAMILSTGLAANQVKSDKLRLLAVAGDKRSPLVPDVPTFAEAGLANFAPASWFALLAPAGTPQDVVKTLNAQVNRLLADRQFRVDVLERNGMEPMGGPPEQLAALMKSDSQRWGGVIRANNIRLE